jgi:hypothetical protein
MLPLEWKPSRRRSTGLAFQSILSRPVSYVPRLLVRLPPSFRALLASLPLDSDASLDGQDAHLRLSGGDDGWDGDLNRSRDGQDAHLGRMRMRRRSEGDGRAGRDRGADRIDHGGGCQQVRVRVRVAAADGWFGGRRERGLDGAGYLRRANLTHGGCDTQSDEGACEGGDDVEELHCGREWVGAG